MDNLDLPTNSEKFDVVLKQLMLVKREIGSSVKKDSANPFHKSKYASLGAHLDLCEEPLARHGLILIPTVNRVGDKSILVATLCHPESSQWIRSYLELPNPKGDSQGLGASITYMRRYATNCMLSLNAEDDDGETAAGRGSHADNKKQAQPAPAVTAPAAPAPTAKPTDIEPPKEPKVTPIQFKEIRENMQLVDADMRKNFHKHMETYWNVAAGDYASLPARVYEPTMTAIRANLNKKPMMAVA